jgi:hypothetical protein
MASVRLTNEIRSDIHRNAMEAFKVAKPMPKPTTWLCDRIRDGIMGSEAYKVLKDMYETRNRYTFTSLGGVPNNVAQTADAVVNLSSKTNFGTTSFPDGTNKTIPIEMVPQIKLFRGSSWGTADFCFEDFSAQTRADLAGPLQQLSKDIVDHYAEQRDYSKKIKDLLDACTTVKQLLTTWPAGESFVPHEHKTRMYTKVTRVERAKQIREEVQFDDSFVNEVVLTAKLVGG